MHYVTCRTGAIEHNWITLSYIHVCICIHWMPSHDFWQQYSAQLHTLWTVPLKSEQRGNVWGPCWAGNITPILTTQQSSKTNRFWFPAEDLILNCRVKINFYWPHNHSMLQYDRSFLFISSPSKTPNQHYLTQPNNPPKQHQWKSLLHSHPPCCFWEHHNLLTAIWVPLVGLSGEMTLLGTSRCPLTACEDGDSHLSGQPGPVLSHPQSSYKNTFL